MCAKKEERWESPVAVHPGELFKEWIEERGMTAKEFAARTGKPERTISLILNGKSGITPETARAFEVVTGIPADYTLRFQADYEADLKRLAKIPLAQREWDGWGSLFPYAEMARVGWVPKVRDVASKMSSIKSFLGLTGEEALTDLYLTTLTGDAFFRKSGKSSRTIYGVAAWIRRGEVLGEKVLLADYSPSEAKKRIPAFRKALAVGDLRALITECREVGINLIFVENIPASSLSGAALWRRKHPLILLSGKGRSLDKLTYNFFHELGHILHNHHKGKIIIDDIEEKRTDESDEERQADHFAREILCTEMRSFASDPAPSGVREEADTLEEAPREVTGDLTHPQVIAYPMAGTGGKSPQRPLEIDFATIND